MEKKIVSTGSWKTGEIHSTAIFTAKEGENKDALLEEAESFKDFMDHVHFPGKPNENRTFKIEAINSRIIFHIAYTTSDSLRNETGGEAWNERMIQNANDIFSQLEFRLSVID